MYLDLISPNSELNQVVGGETISVQTHELVRHAEFSARSEKLKDIFRKMNNRKRFIQIWFYLSKETFNKE